MCAFCEIVAGGTDAHVVLDDDATLAFLDVRPLFPGHTLVVTKKHFETIRELPSELVEPFFRSVRLLAGVVEDALDADGTFVAINNTVSQSVPHLHAHVVPRRRKDGLRGFFWPRTKYAGDEEMGEYAARIRSALG